MSEQRFRSVIAFVLWLVFSTAGMVVLLNTVGCTYGTSQSRVVSTPTGMQVRESGQCVGFGCGASAAYGYGGMWARGGIAPYPYSPADARFGAIEAYRARNAWVRSGAASRENAGGSAVSGGGARDPRLDRLVPYVRHMANAMCNNNLLGSDDCAPPARTSSQTPAVQSAGQQSSGNQATPRVERRRPITEEELE